MTCNNLLNPLLSLNSYLQCVTKVHTKLRYNNLLMLNNCCYWSIRSSIHSYFIFLIWSLIRSVTSNICVLLLSKPEQAKRSVQPDSTKIICSTGWQLFTDILYTHNELKPGSMCLFPSVDTAKCDGSLGKMTACVLEERWIVPLCVTLSVFSMHRCVNWSTLTLSPLLNPSVF